MQEKQPKSSEEIDLLYFLNPIRTGISNYLHRLWRNKIVFFLIVLIITALGYGVRFIIPPAFQTEGLFVSNLLPAKYCGVMIKNLDQLLAEGNLPVAASQLQISAEMASTIKKIQVIADPDTAYHRRDTVPSVFRVSLILSDMKSLDTIQSGIMKYLEGGEYGRKKKEARSRIASALTYAISGIPNSDSLQLMPGTGQSDSYDVGISQQARLLNLQELLRLNEEVSANTNVEVAQPFFTRQHHNYPDYNKYLKYGFLLSLLLALLVILFLGNKQTIKTTN